MRRLPILDEPPRERADAARNRVRILAASERLFAEHGVGAVSMDDVAAAAGVGKGTLYRRFGDKAGLGVAVLDGRERDLQDAILHGEPPLGPGAAPAARLHAFADAYLDYLDRNLELITMSETAAPGARYRSGVYSGWHWHVGRLLGELGFEHPGPIADVVLGALSGELAVALRGRDVDLAEHRSAIHELVDRIAAPGRTPPG